MRVLRHRSYVIELKYVISTSNIYAYYNIPFEEDARAFIMHINFSMQGQIGDLLYLATLLKTFNEKGIITSK